ARRVCARVHSAIRRVPGGVRLPWLFLAPFTDRLTADLEITRSLVFISIDVGVRFESTEQTCEITVAGDEVVTVRAELFVEVSEHGTHVVVGPGNIVGAFRQSERRSEQRLGTRFEQRALEIGVRRKADRARKVERVKHHRLRFERLTGSKRTL